MDLSQNEVEAELFPLEPSLEQLIGKIKVWEYKIQSPADTISSFGGMSRLSYRVSKLVGASSFSSDHGQLLVSTQPLATAVDSTIGDDISLSPVSESRSLNTKSDMRLITRLFYNDLRASIETSGFKLRGSQAYDSKVELASGLQSRHAVISHIANGIAVHPGFYYKLRWIDNQTVLQITPKSVLLFKTDLNQLIKEMGVPADILVDLFDRVRLADGRVVTLRSILDLTSESIIQEEPYAGKSYMQYCRALDPDKAPTDPNSNLLVVLAHDSDICEYASAEGSVPIIDFQSLSHFDRAYYNAVNSRFRTESARRRDSAAKYSQQLRLSAFGVDLKIRPRLSYSGSLDLRRPSQGSFQWGHFNSLAPQSVSFRNKFGQVITVSRSTGHLGAPQDLMRHGDLKAFSVPQEIRTILFYEDDLEEEAKLLRGSLLGTPNSIARGFGSTFGSNLALSEPVPLETQTTALSSILNGADCALIVGQRSQASFSFSKTAYTDAEVAMMNQGIPAQFVTTSTGSGTTYDLPMTRKANNQYFLFVLGASIIAKIGGNTMVLSEETTKEFPENSVVIAYNIARVFESVPQDLKKSEHAAQLTRTSVPISAAVAIMDQAGSEVIHQSPHVIPNESALFAGERGKMIFDGVPDGTKYVVVHKDGSFYSEELDDLKKLGGTQRKIIPVSINTVYVPRLTSTLLSQKFLPLPGQVVPLSSNEFLLCTTDVGDPGTRGWPNPLLVRIHEILEDPLTSDLKWKVVYQIWALTRSHPASMIPTRRPLSIHYSNKMANFIRKAKDAEPSYFGKFTGRKNRFGYHPRPFI